VFVEQCSASFQSSAAKAATATPLIYQFQSSVAISSDCKNSPRTISQLSNSRKLDFRFTEFSEVRMYGVLGR
jgi:hypothetical protein